MKTSDYLGIVTENEIQRLRQLGKPGKTHPLVALALAEPQSQVAVNTENAARHIFNKNPGWLRSLKPRLVDTSNLTDASAALGELRAYGALLETWMTVSPEPIVPGKKVVPEFDVDSGDGGVIVEVHSRQLAKDQAETIIQHHAELQSNHSLAVRTAREGAAVITTRELEVMPFGAPDPKKAGDSVLTNAISRIASIKEDERQIDHQRPFVLWLDIQDPTVWGVPISEEQLAPLYTESKDGYVGTGALWFALYGRKGDSMIESEGFTYRIREMLHDGRFFQIMKSSNTLTRVSAVVYSMPSATVLMENPSSFLALPDGFRASLLKAPFFRLDRSICEWKNGLVKRRIEFERETIMAAAKALSAFNSLLI
jgi:hypothetical protein